MIQTTPNTSSRHSTVLWRWTVSTITVLVMTIGNFAPVAVSTVAQAQPLAAPVSTLTLHVQSAGNSNATFNATPGNTPIHTGDAINQFKYIINVDNTATTDQKPDASGNVPVACTPADPDYPANCKWVSTAGRANHSPIYTQGDQNDFPGGVFTVDGLPVNLPAGRYLISVLADNYKIDGAHFSIPSDGTTVLVEMQPYDLPDATIQAAVFEDMAPTNSAPDLPAERGLAGFVGHIKDYIDEVTTDIYGDPLCGNSHCVSKCYVVDGGADLGYVAPRDAAGRCPFREELAANASMTLIGGGTGTVPGTATIEGKVIIPNVGPNRYALSVTPPDNSGWIQTTTLEGNHDWDAWVMEGATGLDTEFVVAGEPFPATFFGFTPKVDPTHPYRNLSNGAGSITGTGLAVSAYIPPVGGIVGEPSVFGAKPKDKNPIHRMFVSLSDLNNGDQTGFVGEYDCTDACVTGVPFTIPNVPNGDYVLGIWDEPQDYIFAVQNVSVQNGQAVSVGDISMLGWWTTIEGHVFNDLNENGKMDTGEPGIPNFFISMRTRENSVMDRGTVAVTTDANGYYWMESAYPMTQWLVEEAYADGFQTTGITYQADNQPTETTILGQGVDVNVHPIIGLGGRLDWGVKAYAKGTNGGIVGTVSYDTTRNELNPQYAAIEDWQPSISDLPVDLYAPIACGTHANTPCDADGQYELAQDGSFALGQLLNQYITETWERPSGCVARNVDGVPLASPQLVSGQLVGGDQQALPLGADIEGNTLPCLEAPMLGVQFGPMADGVGTPDENFGATVDGNYGFGDGCFMPDGTPGLFDPDTADCVTGSLQSLPNNRDYLVKVEIPDDALGRPMYKVTKEEDINIANGDSFVPQVPPPACAGALHTVDVKGFGADGPNAVDNPTFVSIGGSIYEGQQKPLCDVKLVHVSERKSIAPGFNLFTDVPTAARFWGLIVDDLNFSSNPKSLAYGEKMGIPFAPVGIYDYTNRLITTVESDYNGLFDVLLPSTNRISCPTPSGVCANLYRFEGNDPGTPGKWNANYNPQYRSISAEFEAFAGLTIPADLAPTQVAVSVQLPGMQTLTPISCTLDTATPQFFAIDKPYMRTNASGVARQFNLYGQNFGASPGGSVTLTSATGVATSMTINSWSPTQITFTVPTGFTSTASYQLKITSTSGQSTINALTFQVAATGLSVREVGPGKTYATIQGALDAAAGSNGDDLVVVYPGAVDLTNPRYNGRGSYYENPIMYSPVKLQGVGPGGVRSDNSIVQGSIIDGLAFGGDTQLATDWLTKVASLTWDGNQNVNDGQVIYVLASNNGSSSSTRAGSFGNNFKASIDGFDIRGGDQQGLPGNLAEIFGTPPETPGAVQVETQGGAIFANSYARNLQITNNVIESNGGSYGAIRIGTPNLTGNDQDNHNDNVHIANNRILANGGTNLAGAVGLFNGSHGYEVDHNDLCGNFSAEYGGAISHFGRSDTTGTGINTKVNSIHDNRIYFNRSYDEGAGIMIAGELAPVPTATYGTNNGARGAGPVDIYNNLIQANLADDDGGGIRFLMAASDCSSSSGFQACAINVYNNMVVNNISTHEGGGSALDDAPNVRFYNNTVMKNITTATAITSDGLPMPAGLSTSANSIQLSRALLGNTTANASCGTITASSQVGCFSLPVLFNNIFWDNRAGSAGATGVLGIGAAGDLTPINNWDMANTSAASSTQYLTPTNSTLQTTTGTIASGTNVVGLTANPLVVTPHDIPLTFTTWRANINSTGAIMVTADLTPGAMGNYHIQLGSPAINLGAISKASIPAPAFDIDRDSRSAPIDSGADEFVLPSADLGITKTDGVTSVNQGATVNYTIVVTNAGPNGVTSAPVTDTFPAALTVNSWTCAATAGSSCTASGSANSRTGTVTLLSGGSATFTAGTTLSASATGSLVNTATVNVPADRNDPNTANNSSTDTDTIALPLPTLTGLDNFNRTTTANLNTGAPAGVSWSQAGTLGVNANQALSSGAGFGLPSTANFNGTANSGPLFGAKQAAAFTFVQNAGSPSAPVNNSSLLLKASGSPTLNVYPNSIRVQYQTSSGGQVVVATTTNGLTYTTRGTFASGLFVAGDTLTAMVDSTGTVYVWKNSTFVGSVTIPGTGFWTGTGRIGMQLPATARVDNFAGGTLP